MAKQLPYIDGRGVTYPQSYWRIVALKVNLLQNLAVFTFRGYRDAAARNQNLNPVDERSITVTGHDFTEGYNLVIQKVKNPAEIGYAAADKDPFFSNGQDV